MRQIVPRTPVHIPQFSWQHLLSDRFGPSNEYDNLRPRFGHTPSQTFPRGEPMQTDQRACQQTGHLLTPYFTRTCVFNASAPVSAVAANSFGIPNGGVFLCASCLLNFGFPQTGASNEPLARVSSSRNFPQIKLPYRILPKLFVAKASDKLSLYLRPVSPLLGPCFRQQCAGRS